MARWLDLKAFVIGAEWILAVVAILQVLAQSHPEFGTPFLWLGDPLV
jgi:hypothetical protein